MKILATIFGLLALSQITYTQDNPFTLREEGLCLEAEPSCPNVVQDKGICCRPRGASKKQYFKNYCFGCQAVNFCYIFRAVIHGS